MGNTEGIGAGGNDAQVYLLDVVAEIVPGGGGGSRVGGVQDIGEVNSAVGAYQAQVEVVDQFDVRVVHGFGIIRSARRVCPTEGDGQGLLAVGGNRHGERTVVHQYLLLDGQRLGNILGDDLYGFFGVHQAPAEAVVRPGVVARLVRRVDDEPFEGCGPHQVMVVGVIIVFLQQDGGACDTGGSHGGSVVGGIRVISTA